jgi:hypothetical protein
MSWRKRKSHKSPTLGQHASKDHQNVASGVDRLRHTQSTLLRQQAVGLHQSKQIFSCLEFKVEVIDIRTTTFSKPIFESVFVQHLLFCHHLHKYRSAIKNNFAILRVGECYYIRLMAHL